MNTENLDDLSYSGIANILDGTTKEEQLQFLHLLDDHYQNIKLKQLQLEKELENLKTSRAITVGGFLHCHKILIQSSDKPLSFVHGDNLVVIKRLENGNMDYELYPITLTSNEEKIKIVNKQELYNCNGNCDSSCWMLGNSCVCQSITNKDEEE